MNMYTLLSEALAARPERLALVDFRTGAGMSAAALLSRVNELADAIAPLLPPEKTVVAVCLPNGPDVVAAVLALWKLNHAVMPLPHSVAQTEREKVLLDGPAASLLLAANKADGDFQNVAGLGFRRFRAERKPVFPSENLAFVRFTSGTTENARGVLISHDAIFCRAKSFGRALGLQEDASVLWHLDMSYHFTTSITAFLLHRCEIHLGQLLLPARFAEWLRLRPVDLFFSMPFFYDQWVDSPSEFPRTSTRFYVTGQTLSEKTMRTFRERFGIAVRRMYGVIEVGIPALGADGPDPRTVGKVAESFEIRLEDGVILVRGPGSFDGYLMGDKFDFVPPASPWFNTGDLGEWTSAQELVIVGRRKEMIMAPGFKFFPSEVERVLETASGVTACAVYMNGDQLTASYEGDADPAALAEFARTRIERAKIPGRFVRVEKLPRTASGKLLRRETP